MCSLSARRVRDYHQTVYAHRESSANQIKDLE